jgi:hypothetical protein
MHTDSRENNLKEELCSIILHDVTTKEKEEDSKVAKEEDSTEEEDQLYVITVISLDIWCETI